MDQIIFGMENQKKELLLDSESGLIVQKTFLSKEDLAAGDAEERYFQLPEWKPSDGFRLMEGFAGALKNPIYRERLREILSSGRGVFRGFKNVLKERPDLEKKWFLYKERQMKQRVREWYSDLCGYWDVRDAGDEPVDTEDLFLGDFSVQIRKGDDPEILQYRQDFFDELYREYSENLQRILVRKNDWRGRCPDLALKAVTPGGVVGGILTAFFDESGGQLFLFIDSLYILPEFRGAGIASGLVDYTAGIAYEKTVTNLFCFIQAEGDVMLENLKRKGFKLFRQTLELDVPSWFSETGHSLK